ncbi:MAG TPA: helix-turn-helix transcriptional regulator [Solirubrobacterales bacterium]|nr:helix-turn-helix transcriptional regulator [Solirubrobacterales bacterium]
MIPERITEARLNADMSRSDLAYAIRRQTGGHIKATDRGVLRWEKGENAPRDGVVAAIAAVTGRAIEFFYTDADEPLSKEAEADPFRGSSPTAAARTSAAGGETGPSREAA